MERYEELYLQRGGKGERICSTYRGFTAGLDKVSMVMDHEHPKQYACK